MGLFGVVRNTIQSFFWKTPPPVQQGEGERPSYRDTLSVIHDLLRLVRNDPEAVDIYMALGNLFRAQGDLERAVMIREGLIARPGLNNDFKARSYFELGQDYHRAGVIDRALAAFGEAEKLGYAENEVTAQRADLFAQAGEFERAAEEYGRLRHPLAQAHYLVRHAGEAAQGDRTDKAERILKKALRIYPGSVEAWSAITSMNALACSWRKTSSYLERGLERIAPKMRFLVLDALLETEIRVTGGFEDSVSSPAAFASDLRDAVIPVLEKQEPQILLHYYGALLLLRAKDIETVDVWLDKALVVQPDFWAARLQSLTLSVEKHELPPVVAMQIGYLADELRHIKRFVCSVCGFRENHVFYRCRRCNSWHSLSFRLSLQE